MQLTHERGPLGRERARGVPVGKDGTQGGLELVRRGLPHGQLRPERRDRGADLGVDLAHDEPSRGHGLARRDAVDAEPELVEHDVRTAVQAADLVGGHPATAR